MFEVGADEDVAARDQLDLTTAEARLLAPDHPFLRVGRWRAFAGKPAGRPRLVASVDPRQASPAGAVGCLGFVRLGSASGPGSAAAVPARDVLDAAIDWLRSQGIATVRAPVQLSTWYGHRATTGGFPEPGTAGVPQFPLEPEPEQDLPGLLERAGFRPAHRAVSCLEDCRAVVAGTATVIRRVRAAGVSDRPIRLADLDDELRLIHRLAETTFEGTWGLSPIAFEEFASIYRPLDGRADPELIRILETADGTAIGFALGLRFPQAGARDGSFGDLFVLKSIGVTAAARQRWPGVGAALTGLIHRVALDRGATAGVHALMAEGSGGHRLSLRWGSVFRSYATYELAVR
jgi:hypothetical protein